MIPALLHRADLPCPTMHCEVNPTAGQSTWTLLPFPILLCDETDLKEKVAVLWQAKGNDHDVLHLNATWLLWMISWLPISSGIHGLSTCHQYQ